MFGHESEHIERFRILPAIICALLLAALMLPGCGLAGIGVMAAATSGGGGGGNPVPPPRNNTPTVFVTTPVRQVGDVTVSYRLVDVDADNCSVVITYGINSADPVNPATPASASPPTTNLTSSDSGVDHTFIWDIATDLGNGLVTGVSIAIVANDGKDNSATQATGSFEVGNDAPVIEMQTPTGEQSGDVGIIYAAKDTSSDLVSLEVEFRLDNSSSWAPAAAISGVATVSLMTAPDPGIQHVFLWNSLDNVGGVGPAISGDCQVRARAIDAFDTGGWSTSNAFTIHNNFPPSAPIIDIGTPGLITHRGVIPIGFRLHDTEGDPIDALLEWSDGVTGWHKMTEYPFGSGAIEFSDGTTGLPTPIGGAGAEYRFFWHSLADIDKDLPYVRIRLTPSDPYQSGTPAEVLFNSEILNHPFTFDEIPDFGAIRNNIISGDFDNNGFDDLAASFSDIDNIAFYPCGPNGFNSAGRLLPSASSMFGFAVGDFDNDGIVDLASKTKSGTTTIWVYDGQDGIGLDNSSYTILTLPDIPGHIMATDVNNDGIEDLVVSCQDKKVYIFEAVHGSKLSFSRRTELQTLHCYGIKSGDVNGDDVTDIVGVSYSMDVIYVWLGNSGYYPNDSIRTDLWTFPDEYPQAVKVADINGDNIDDIIAAHFMNPNINYWLGTPVLGPDNDSRITFNTYDNYSNIVTVDMDLDGINDVIVHSSFYPKVRLYPCDILGPDPARVIDYTFRDSPNDAIAADVFDEGVKSLLLMFSQEGVYIYKPWEGQFPDPDSYLTTPCTEAKLVTGDFTGTGTLGFTANNRNSKTGIKFLRDQCGLVKESSADRVSTDLAAMPSSVDYDNDGVKDLFSGQVGAGQNGVAYYRGVPGGGPEMVKTGFIPTKRGPFGVFKGDFNGDGIGDISVFCVLDNVAILVLHGNSGDISGWSRTEIDVGGKMGIMTSGGIAGDFDNDGIDDIVVCIGQLAKIKMYRGQPGSGPSADCASEMSGGIMPSGLELADFNGDMIPDVVTLDRMGNSAYFYLGEDGVGLTNSNGGMRSVGGIPYSIVVADFNLDGYDDFVTADNGSNTCTYYKGSPTGLSLTPDQTLNVPGGPTAVKAGDFNADGFLDLAVGCSTGNTIHIFPGAPGDGLKDGTARIVDMPIIIIYMESGDVNADGIDDVIAWNFWGTDVYYLPGRVGTGPKNNGFGVINTPAKLSFNLVEDINADGLGDLIMPGQDYTLRLFLSHPGRQVSTFRLTTAGGTFKGRRYFGNAELTVPAGAIDVDKDIVFLHPLRRPLPKTPAERYRPISIPVAIMRETLSLSQNASLTIPISSAVADADWAGANHSKVFVFRHERETDSWVKFDPPNLIIDDGKREVTLSIERFGYYVVVLKQ